MSASTAGNPRPYAVHDGLGAYRFGSGRPVLLMPGPHRLEQPGYRSADALIAGLTRLGCQVITFDPPGSGHSTRPARLGMPEMHQCADEALEMVGVAGVVDAFTAATTRSSRSWNLSGGRWMTFGSKGRRQMTAHADRVNG
jgi:pimeloyl-ACP methyl ester carboxylesterase